LLLLLVFFVYLFIFWKRSCYQLQLSIVHSLKCNMPIWFRNSLLTVMIAVYVSIRYSLELNIT